MPQSNSDIRQRLFSVVAADGKNNLFLCDPSHVGFGAYCHLLAGNSTGLQEKLNALLNLELTGCLMQVIQYTSKDVNALLERYAALASSCQDQLLLDLTRDRIRMIREATDKPLDEVSRVRARDTVMLITVKVPVSSLNYGEKELKRIVELQQSFMQTVRSCDIPHMPLTPERYKRFMHTVLNQRPTATWRESANTPWDETVLMSEQLLDGDNAIDIDARGLWLGETARVRVMTAKHRPKEMTFSTAARYLGDTLRGNRGVRENVLLTLNIYFPDTDNARQGYETQRVVAQKQAEGKLARFNSRYTDKSESLDILMSAVGDGDRVARSYLSMAVIADSEEASIAAASNVKTYFRELQFQMTEDHFGVLPLFSQMLPFAAEDAVVGSLQKYKTTATRHIVPQMPIFGSWRGSKTPSLILFGRDGQLMTTCPFDTASSYSACVAAKSGAGKSFFINHLIERFRAMGARIWCIDVGKSYKQLCQLLGGYFLEFSGESAPCINPFSSVTEYDDQEDILVGIVRAMATEEGDLDAFQIARLKRIMKETFEKYGQEMMIDDLAQALLCDEDRRVQDVGHQLFAFTSQGSYGRYFNGPNTFQFDNPFVVLELDGLSSRKHLQKVVLLTLMSEINQAMYHGPKKVKKVLLVDECWEHLGTKEVKDFIVRAYRRARKANGSVITITQSVSDYYLNEGTQAIVDNSPTMYLLAQKKTSIEFVKEKKRLPFDEYEYRLLESVHRQDNDYSEVFCITENGNGVGRLIVSEFQKKLYSTTPDEVAMIEQLRAEGMSLTDAINTLIAREQSYRKAS